MQENDKLTIMCEINPREGGSWLMLEYHIGPGRVHWRRIMGLFQIGESTRPNLYYVSDRHSQ